MAPPGEAWSAYVAHLLEADDMLRAAQAAQERALFQRTENLLRAALLTVAVMPTLLLSSSFRPRTAAMKQSGSGGVASTPTERPPRDARTWPRGRRTIVLLGFARSCGVAWRLGAVGGSL